MTSTSQRRLTHSLYLALTLLLAGVLLYYSLRGVAWAQVGHILASSRLQYAAMGLGLTTAALVTRAIRWRVLLGGEARIGIWTSFTATSAGYLGNNLLPARAGELIRMFFVTRTTGASKAFVLTTMICERVSDAIALLIIAAGTIMLLPTRPGWLSRAAVPFCLLGALGIAAIVISPLLAEPCKRLFQKVGMPARARDGLSSVLDSVVSAVRQLHEPSLLLTFTGLTVAIWLLDGLTALSFAASLGLELSLPVMMLLNSAIGLGSALPSTPGYVGVYQFVTISVLTPFGVSTNAALAYAVAAQGWGYLVVILWGTIGIAQYQRIKPKQPAPELVPTLSSD